MALIKHHEIPILPATDDPLDTIDDRMWGLMTKCWDYEPENRPSCEDIQRFIAGLRVPNDRFVSPTPTGGNSQAFWKSVKAKSETTINYAHISQILLRVSCSSAIFPAVVHSIELQSSDKKDGMIHVTHEANSTIGNVSVIWWKEWGSKRNQYRHVIHNSSNDIFPVTCDRCWSIVAMLPYNAIRQWVTSNVSLLECSPGTSQGNPLPAEKLR